MSRDAGLYLILRNTTNAFVSVLDALLANGWTMAGPDSRILYVAEGDFGDWADASATEMLSIRQELGRAAIAGRPASVSLWTEENRVNASLIRSSETQVIVSCGSDSSLPTFGRFLDPSNWIRRIVPPLLDAGLDIEQLKWSDCP